VAVVLDTLGAWKHPGWVERENTDLACTSTRRAQRVLIVVSPDGVTRLILGLVDPDVAATTIRSNSTGSDPVASPGEVPGEMASPVEFGCCPWE